MMNAVLTILNFSVNENLTISNVIYVIRFHRKTRVDFIARHKLYYVPRTTFLCFPLKLKFYSTANIAVYTMNKQ